MTIIPGEIDPLACYISLSGTPTATANAAYTFPIYFVDLWGNVHDTTLSDEISDGMVVSVAADYEDHDNYPSPIGVADLTNWESTYGTSLTGSASDNNDGTITGSVTIQRAGSYMLSAFVDGVEVIGSPFSSADV